MQYGTSNRRGANAKIPSIRELMPDTPAPVAAPGAYTPSPRKRRKHRSVADLSALNVLMTPNNTHHQVHVQAVDVEYVDRPLLPVDDGSESTEASSLSQSPNFPGDTTMTAAATATLNNTAVADAVAEVTGQPVSVTTSIPASVGGPATLIEVETIIAGSAVKVPAETVQGIIPAQTGTAIPPVDTSTAVAATQAAAPAAPEALKETTMTAAIEPTTASAVTAPEQDAASAARAARRAAAHQAMVDAQSADSAQPFLSAAVEHAAAVGAQLDANTADINVLKAQQIELEKQLHAAKDKVTISVPQRSYGEKAMDVVKDIPLAVVQGAAIGAGVMAGTYLVAKAIGVIFGDDQTAAS